MNGAPPVQFGFILPQRGALFGATSVQELLDLTRRADAEPLFDSVWVGDSLYAKPRPDSLTLLGGLATITERVKLGVGCMASFPVRDPLMFAFQWATLDWLSSGRMLLAVCTGIVGGGMSAAEGAPWSILDKDRARRMSEHIDIVRRLWSEQHPGFEGEFHRFERFDVAPKPVQQPCPIWIAANPRTNQPKTMENALRRVAQKADGWMTVVMFPGSFRVMWGKVQELLQAEGRDPAAFPNALYHNININEDRQAAFDESKRFLDLYYGPVFTDDMIAAWTAHGSPEACAEQLRDLRDQGAKTIALRFTSWDQMGQYRRLVEEVLPNV